MCGVLNNVRKPGHSTHWQGYDLQQTIVIGVVSLRRTLTRSFWLSRCYICGWPVVRNGVKDPFLHKARDEAERRQTTRGGSWRISGSRSDGHCVGKEHNTDRPSATAVSLHSDWPNINFLPLSLLDARVSHVLRETERNGLKTFAQHCGLGVWANKLTSCSTEKSYC